MPDIAMCPGGECLKKDSCYRYKAKPCPYMQSYFSDPPLKENGECDYYWELEKDDLRVYLDSVH